MRNLLLNRQPCCHYTRVLRPCRSELTERLRPSAAEKRSTARRTEPLSDSNERNPSAIFHAHYRFPCLPPNVSASLAGLRTNNIAPPASTAHASKNARPGAKELVAVRKYPIKYGPANPPKFPTELMNPIDAAAADAVSSSVGSAQKLGMNAVVHAPTTIIAAKLTGRFPRTSSVRPSAAPPKNKGKAVCHRRSPVRSECQPFSSIAPNPAT